MPLEASSPNFTFTVGDLATFKYCRYAEAIVQAAQYEDVGTDAERKAERAAAKLS